MLDRRCDPVVEGHGGYALRAVSEDGIREGPPLVPAIGNELQLCAQRGRRDLAVPRFRGDSVVAQHENVTARHRLAA